MRSLSPFRGPFALFALATLLALLPAPVASAATAPAQTAPADAPPAMQPASIRASLLTVYPGQPVWTRYGHSAIRITYPGLGFQRTDPKTRAVTLHDDVVFNFGTFTFGPGFTARYLRGQLDYWLSVNTYADFEKEYVAEGRAIVEQELNLPAESRLALLAGLMKTAQDPKLRYYRYEFLFNNCSTKIRDFFEAACPSIRYDPAFTTERSFRDLLSEHLGNDSFVGLTTNVLMGLHVDRSPRTRELAFLPIYLAQLLEHATVEIDGRRVPLAGAPKVVYGQDRMVFPKPWLPWPAIALWALLAGGVAWSLLRWKRNLDAVVLSRLVDAGLLGAIGLAGAALLVLSVVTAHKVVLPNWNVLWLLPTHALAAVVLVVKPRSRLLHRYLWVVAAWTILLLATWPLWPQDFPDAVIPLVALVGLRCGWLAWYLPSPPPRKPSPPSPAKASSRPKQSPTAQAAPRATGR